MLTRAVRSTIFASHTLIHQRLQPETQSGRLTAKLATVLRRSIACVPRLTTSRIGSVWRQHCGPPPALCSTWTIALASAARSHSLIQLGTSVQPQVLQTRPRASAGAVGGRDAGVMDPVDPLTLVRETCAAVAGTAAHVTIDQHGETQSSCRPPVAPAFT